MIKQKLEIIKTEIIKSYAILGAYTDSLILVDQLFLDLLSEVEKHDTGK